MQIKKIVGNLNESNTYIIYDDIKKESIIIDPSEVEQINNFMAVNNLNLSYVFLTHEHYDHIYGLNDLRSNFKFKVISSVNCSHGIQNSKLNFSEYFNDFLNYKNNSNNKINYKYVSDKADITFKNKIEMNWIGHEIKLHETPGHSKGSISIVIDDRYLFTGDSLLYDLDVILKFPGGSKRDYRDISIPFYKKLNYDIIVYPGHGESFLLHEFSKY